MKTCFLGLVLVLCLAEAKVVNVGLKHEYGKERLSTFNPNLREKLYRSQQNGDEPNNNAMGGNILPVGIYWMTVEVGSPAQTFSAAVDSGSGDLIIPSLSCVGCHSENTGEYNPRASSTSKDVGCGGELKCANCTHNQCTFYNVYQTCNLTDPEDPCSVTGPLYKDTYALGGESGVAPFGAITYQTSNFQQFFVIDAVVGFIPYLSSWGGQSLFQTLVDEGKYDNIYAMCMSPNDGGVITLGGTDDRLRSGDFMYTPQTSAPYYEIKIGSFGVSGKSMGTKFSTVRGGSKFIVDSGTNVLLLKTANFNNVKDAIYHNMCSVSPAFSGDGVCNNNGDFFNQVCYPYTEAEIAQFPQVTMNAIGEDGEDSVPLVMEGADYVVANGTTGDYCFGIKDTGRTGLEIIGDNTMQKYYVSFDMEGHRLGWADVDLGYCLKIKGELTNEVRTFAEEVKNHL